MNFPKIAQGIDCRARDPNSRCPRGRLTAVSHIFPSVPRGAEANCANPQAKTLGFFFESHNLSLHNEIRREMKKPPAAGRQKKQGSPRLWRLTRQIQLLRISIALPQRDVWQRIQHARSQVPLTLHNYVAVVATDIGGRCSAPTKLYPSLLHKEGTATCS